MPGVTNAFYAQSGGVTAVINASAAGVIETARQHPERIGTVLAGHRGILGALTEDLIDTGQESAADIAALKDTPGGAFGSCRYKLQEIATDPSQYERLIEVFRAHNIGYFFYNGGGDSADTCLKVSQLGESMGYPVQAIHIPKTIDNDLPNTDCSPGFGSAAKYVATSVREVGLDVESMCSTSTKVFILEVLGRHAGWTVAAGGLAGSSEAQPPHLLLFPEIRFEAEPFLVRVRDCVATYGYCVIVASEGLRRSNGDYVADADSHDAFGHQQLGGVAATLATLIRTQLGFKVHHALADYMMRAARHLASAIDLDQAYAVGKAAVDYALAGRSGIMVSIQRMADDPYEWTLGEAELTGVANIEKTMPASYISDDGYHITDACRRYLQPLIQGERTPPFVNGLPRPVRLKKIRVDKKTGRDFPV